MSEMLSAFVEEHQKISAVFTSVYFNSTKSQQNPPDAVCVFRSKPFQSYRDTNPAVLLEQHCDWEQADKNMIRENSHATSCHGLHKTCEGVLLASGTKTSAAHCLGLWDARWALHCLNGFFQHIPQILNQDWDLGNFEPLVMFLNPFMWEDTLCW